MSLHHIPDLLTSGSETTHDLLGGNHGASHLLVQKISPAVAFLNYTIFVQLIQMYKSLDRKANHSDHIQNHSLTEALKYGMIAGDI